MDTKSPTKSIRYVSIGSGSPGDIEGAIVDEALVCISVNGQELATFMCTPVGIESLALGFLANEGIIESLADIHHVHVSKTSTCVDVWLHDQSFTPPSRTIITSGCGGGVTFDDLSHLHQPLFSDLQANPEQVADLMRQLHQGAASYKEARGIHTAALARDDGLLLQVEDVGRHNCLDKLRGSALQQEIPTENSILLSSGRISSEMINKARRMGMPIVCSRTSPTSLSVALAEVWNMTIVAYVRQSRMRIYTHPERILWSADE